MQIFHFDPETGTKGEPIGHFPYCHATSNVQGRTAKLPVSKTAEWRVATRAEYLDGSPTRFDFPVCFCLGELTCGIGRAWHWIALLPITEKEMTP